MQTPAELNTFVQQWTSNPNGCREVFLLFQSCIQAHSDITIEFVARPGLTYSLRATRAGQDRPLFVLMDVIDENPRWLSVCFYGDMITDPEEYGDLDPKDSWVKTATALTRKKMIRILPNISASGWMRPTRTLPDKPTACFSDE